MRRVAYLCLLLAGCHPSLISLPATPERADRPFSSPAVLAPQPDSELVQMCRALLHERQLLAKDIIETRDPSSRAVLSEAAEKADAGLGTCRKEGVFP